LHEETKHTPEQIVSLLQQIEVRWRMERRRHQAVAKAGLLSKLTIAWRKSLFTILLLAERSLGRFWAQ
jgi:hypothetical protein